ncbi:MAG: ImmA/IrrE family metallo-endopeptidase [Nitrospirae bacterium]|nr:ImmA/IrrE family metallo-endopeptidase [Nitrospirota bacterium]
MNPEYYASTLLNDLNVISLPVNPFTIACSLKLNVVEVDADSFDGLYLRVGDKVVININKNITNIGRKHFTLAHEIAHHCIPSHDQNNYQCIPNPFKNKDIKEVEADQFASEFLLPERLFKPLLYQYKPDFESIQELADDCGTSLTATAIKFAKHTEDCCVLIATSENKIKWFQKSSSFPYWIEHGKQVSPGTLTASYSLKGVVQEAESQEVHATFWFNGKGIDNATTLFESCVPMIDYGVVLTMLWFPEPPYDNSGYCDEDKEHRYEESSWKWQDPKE